MGKPKNEQRFAEMGREDYFSQASYDVDMCSIEGQTREKDVFIRIEQSRENILKKSILKAEENWIKELEREIVEARPTLSEKTVTTLKDAVHTKFQWFISRRKLIEISRADLEIILYYDSIQLNKNGYTWRMLADGYFWNVESTFQLTEALNYYIPAGVYSYSDINYTFQGLVTAYNVSRDEFSEHWPLIFSYNAAQAVGDYLTIEPNGAIHNLNQAMFVGQYFADFGFKFYKDNFPKK